MSRPGFYGKLLALKSLLRSSEGCEGLGEFVFLNDGPVPEDRLELMSSWGEVVELPRVGQVGSWQAALDQVDARAWPDDDIVYFVEDDYLHLRSAIPALVAVGREVPEASYLALYVYVSLNWRVVQHFQVGERAWLRAESTTTTFAARIGALRADIRLHRYAYYAGGAWDRDSCLSYQGYNSYPWAGIIGDLCGWEPGTRRPLERRIKRAGAQAMLNLFAVRRRFARHLLITPWPALATHMSLPYLSPEVDWEAAAAEAAAWNPDYLPDSRRATASRVSKRSLR